MQLWNLLASFQHSCNVDLRPNEMRTVTYTMLTADPVQNLDSSPYHGPWMLDTTLVLSSKRCFDMEARSHLSKRGRRVSTKKLSSKISHEKTP